MLFLWKLITLYSFGQLVRLYFGNNLIKNLSSCTTLFSYYTNIKYQT